MALVNRITNAIYKNTLTIASASTCVGAASGLTYSCSEIKRLSRDREFNDRLGIYNQTLGDSIFKTVAITGVGACLGCMFGILWPITIPAAGVATIFHYIPPEKDE